MSGCEGQSAPRISHISEGNTMIKKMFLTGGALALLSSVTLGVPLFSYARCGVNWLRSSASDAMPMEWELKRARQMIADLKPEIESNAKRIAREKVEVARLETQLEETDQRLAKTQSDIERLSEDLRSENPVLHLRRSHLHFGPGQE